MGERGMISRITGSVVRVGEDTITLKVGPLAVEVLVPARLARELALQHPDGELTLHTLFIIEGGVGASHLSPRLIGFTEAREKEFYELFTRVKGIGVRRALRALVLPIEQIAQAIESRDVASLKALPEIGSRTAESIVAELQGKVEKFVLPAAAHQKRAKTQEESDLLRQAIMLLRNLQYSQAEAEQMVEETFRRFPNTTSLDEMIQRVFQTSGKP